MWCPINFYTLHHVTDACEDAAAELVPYIDGKELVYSDKEKTTYDHESSNSLRRLVVESKLLELFIIENRHSACACSPQGDILRLSFHIVRPVIFNHWLQYNETFSRHPALLYVDISSAKIDLFGTARRIRDWALAGDASHAEAWQERALEDFSQLDGWSICYPQEEVSVSEADILKLWERYRKSRKAPPETQARGRPRLREKVMEAYVRVFPNGHAGESLLGLAGGVSGLRRSA